MLCRDRFPEAGDVVAREVARERNGEIPGRLSALPRFRVCELPVLPQQRDCIVAEGLLAVEASVAGLRILVLFQVLAVRVSLLDEALPCFGRGPIRLAE